MINFLNFNAQQLQETSGFKRKVKKVASNMGISKLLYSEIINIETSAIDILIIDNNMYFHKVHLYSEEAVKMLNSEFGKIASSLGIAKEESLANSETVENFNLIDEISSILSKSMELLNVENTYNIDQLENVSSSGFDVSIENFTYQEVYEALEPFARTSSLIYSFKVINLSKTSAEILAITTECKIYQYTIYFDSCYARFFNRYVSTFIPYEQFKYMRLNLKEHDFSKSLRNCIRRDVDVSGFLSFLLTQYKSKIDEKGFGEEGLKNVYNFFLETSTDKEDAKKKIRHYFMNIPTYIQKKKQEQ